MSCGTQHQHTAVNLGTLRQTLQRNMEYGLECEMWNGIDHQMMESRSHLSNDTNNTSGYIPLYIGCSRAARSGEKQGAEAEPAGMASEQA